MNKRGITDGTYHYIYNHFFNASHPLQAFPYGGGDSLDAMEEIALTDSDMAARVEFYTYRAPQELYNTVADPGSEINLANDPTARSVRARLQWRLLQWMRDTNDPVLDDYEHYLTG